MENENQNQAPVIDQITVPNVPSGPTFDTTPQTQFQPSPSMNGARLVYEEKKISMGKIIGIIVAVLIVLGLIAGGVFYLYVFKPKTEAKNYLKNEGAFFADSVKAINDLSTDKDVSMDAEKDTNHEAYYKKLEEEKNKADKVAASIKASKEKNAVLKANKFVGVFDGVLKQYYVDASKVVDKYDKYLAFKVITEKENGITAQVQKTIQLMVTLKTDADLNNVSASMKQVVQLMNTYMETYKNTAEPEGYADVKQKEIDLGKKMINIFSSFAKAIDDKNLEALKKAADEFGAFFSDANKDPKIIEDLQKQYFEKMHGEFLSAGKGADNVKSELIKKGVELKIEAVNVGLESW